MNDQLTQAVARAACALERMGAGDQYDKGAIEYLAMEVGRVADGLHDIAEAIREAQCDQ